MAKRIFITATNTNIGKTYVTKLLLKEFAKRGFRVGVFKPIETGVIDEPLDGKELLEKIKSLNKEFDSINVEDIVPIQYKLASAPYVASKNRKLDFYKLDNSIKKLEKYCDILLIEGAGGLLVPIDSDNMMIDLIKYFKAKTLLVTHCSLGCINDTLLSKQALESRNIEHIIAFNCRNEDDNFSIISEPYLTQSKFKYFKIKENIDTICDVLYNN